MMNLATTTLCLGALTVPSLAQQASKPNSPAPTWAPPTSLSTGAFLGGSDDCATAQAIAGQGTFSFDTITATTGAEGQLETICDFFGATGIATDVWYEWTADASGMATVSLCTGGTGDPKVAIYPGGGCPIDGTSIACNDDSCGLLSQVAFSVTTGSSYMIQLGTFPGGQNGSGTFDISISSNNCGSTAPDSFEPNDICADAFIDPPPGTYHNRFIEAGLSDWIRIDVPAGRRLMIDTMPYDNSIDLEAELRLGPTCPGTPLSSGTNAWNNCLGWANTTGSQAAVFHRVWINDNSPCALYKVRFNLAPINCTNCTGADLLEENDACVDAEALDVEAFHTNLTVQIGDDDWYSFNVPAGGTVAFSTFFEHTCGNLDVEIYDSCGGSPILTSLGSTPWENVDVTNSGSVKRTYYARVFIGPGSGSCTTYDLVTTALFSGGGVGGPGTGATFCGDGSINSTGFPAQLICTGFQTDLAIATISNIPAGQPGLLYAGPNQVNFPFGCGTRCIGGSVTRGPILFPNGLGSTSYGFDMSVPGADLLQFWYRDPLNLPNCGGVFNLSNALE